jgi:sarcosine oxidase
MPSKADNSFDAIVIGVGSMGSAACYFLAQRGYKVLGLDQFDVPHEQGAHTGQSRLIRKAYFEHPDYVPLMNRAYENWKSLENETGTQLYYRTGLAYFGKPDHEIMKGIKKSASLYNISIETIDTSAAAKRFPAFTIPDGFEILFEPDAGFVRPEKTVSLYVQQAINKGAKIHTKEKVTEWKKNGKGITVVTNKDTYYANKLIITAGAWAGKVIPGLADKIKITRQFIAWIKPKKEKDFLINNFPCWLLADDLQPGAYYGFPFLDNETFGEPAGLKIAYHYPGLITDPDNVNRQLDAGDMKDINYVLDKYLPDAFESLNSFKTCLYANSPDEDFIIDKLPGYDDVIIACGFSGHGFKFVPVVGEILADLAIDGVTKLPIDFLNVKRFDPL